jgi:hypothetical protein
VFGLSLIRSFVLVCLHSFSQKSSRVTDNNSYMDSKMMVGWLVGFMVFNAIFNNVSVISCP